jgi:hypothetical protein
MFHKRTFTLTVAVLAIVGSLEAQEPSARQTAQERAQAELDAPKLADVLELEPSMTVADVGTGDGAMTVLLGRWLKSGRVLATELGAPQLARIRDYARREGLNNVTVIEGAAASTNLPAACCDAISCGMCTTTSPTSSRSTGACTHRSSPEDDSRSSTLWRGRVRRYRLACLRIARDMAFHRHSSSPKDLRLA